MSNSIWNTEPNRVEKDRSVTFEWPIGERDDEGKLVLTTLHVSHQKAGINYYTYERTTEDHIIAGLRSEVDERRPGESYSMRCFTMFSGVKLVSYPDGQRFSRKRLHARADEALAELRRLADDGNNVVVAFFSGRQSEI